MKKIFVPDFLSFPVTEQDKMLLKSMIKHQYFKKGEILFAQGEVCARIYFIRSGMIKMSYTTLEGKEMIKSFISEGEMFGSLYSQLTGGGSTFSVIALEDLEVETLDYAVLVQVIDRNPELQKMLVNFFQQLALKKEMREYEFLCLSAQQRYQKFCEQYPKLLSRIKQADLALYLGITPIALSRLKHRKSN